MSHCILCSSKKLKNIQKINTKLIVDLYKNELNIDVAPEFGDIQFIDTFKCANCELIFFDPTLTGSEKFYGDLQYLANSYYSDSRPEFLEALKYIDEHAKVLEIGAGSAHFANKLDVFNYVGLEYSQEAIETARTRGVKLVKESIEVFSQNNIEQFDVVCSFHVLEHVSNPNSFIESSLKALKKGGKFICAVPCSDSFYTSNHNRVLNILPHHLTRWSLKTFNHVSEKFDLDINALYVDKIMNPKDHFEIKSRTLFFNFMFPRKQIILNEMFLKIFHKVFKKINRTTEMYKLDNSKKNQGNNMMIIATKK